MAKTPLRKSPLQMPANSAEFLRTFVFDRAPTTSDWRNFKISDLWIHRDPSGSPPYGYFVLVDKPNKSGVWLDIGGTQSGDIQTLTGDAGGAIDPDSNGNIDVLGGTNINTAGTTNTITANLDAAIEVDSISFDSGTNLLSNYVAPTNWTPQLEFGGATTGITYLNRGATYSRIGNVVFFSLDFNLTSKGSATGDATITGLPLVTGPSISYGGRISVFNLPATSYAIWALLGSTTSVFSIFETPNTGGANIPVDETYFNNASGLGVAGVYFTS